ncbi:hypothetical protein KKB99_06180 [bacterium]|nr:hypothetical protein [bacterium]MBU1025575.1 hypothetical protein [bacterium]
MTLEGLESIGFIIREKTQKDELKKLFVQAKKKLADAGAVGLSNESR